jgi:hypothetical protein
MRMGSEPNFEGALEALKRERDLYAKILELSREQRRLAEAGSTEELLAVLAEKGRLAEEAAQASEGSRELKRDWAEKKAGMGADDAARGQELLDAVAGILKQVLAEEEECERSIGQRKHGTMEDLLKLQKGRKIAQAYGKKPPQDPRFKDERK